jgi:hypothetical protein
MHLYLLIFSFIQYLFSFATNITRNLSKAIKGILVANVTCDYNFVIEIVGNMCFSSSACPFHHRDLDTYITLGHGPI